MQKTIAPDSAETFGKYVLCNQPKECLSGNGSGLISFKLGVHVPESDSAIFTFQDVFFVKGGKWLTALP